METSTYPIQNIITFSYYCNKCKRNHKVDCNTNYVCDPNIEYITCKCGKKIAIILLKYFYKSKTLQNEKNDKYQILN